MTPLEKMARAILDCVPLGYVMTRGEAEIYARAALLAMREPDVGMVRKGCMAIENAADEPEEAMRDGYDMWKPSARDSFTAMIDHVLESGG